MSDTAALSARFVGDDPHLGKLPEPPGGLGALVCQYWFDSKLEVVRGDRVIYSRSNYNVWVPPPVVLVDGRKVRASWSGWWLPMRAGPHEIEVCEPVPARLRVELTAGTNHQLRYRVNLRIRKDYLDGPVLEWLGEATLRPTND